MTRDELNTAHASTIDTGEIPSPATPEGDAISKAAAIAAAEVFNGPASDSDFLNGQSTAAQQIIAALRSLPPQDGEREQIERLTAERDTIAAAAFEAAARLCWAEVRRREDQLSGPVHGEIQTARWQAGKLEADHLATKIEALTPADAKATLDAMIQGAAMTECAAFSAGYEAGERDGKPAALTAQPVAQEPVAWPFDLDKTVIRALRYLSENDRPIGGEDTFNRMHLLDLADKLQRFAARPLYAHPATPAPVEAGLREAVRILLDEHWTEIRADEGDASKMPVRIGHIRALECALRAQSAPVGGKPVAPDQACACCGYFFNAINPCKCGQRIPFAAPVGREVKG